MISWLIELFTPTPNDWELIEVDHAYWNTTVRTDFGTHQEKNTAIYEIFIISEPTILFPTFESLSIYLEYTKKGLVSQALI